MKYIVTAEIEDNCGDEHEIVELIVEADSEEQLREEFAILAKPQHDAHEHLGAVAKLHEGRLNVPECGAEFWEARRAWEATWALMVTFRGKELSMSDVASMCHHTITPFEEWITKHSVN